MRDPLQELLASVPFVVLDGGLATQLERRGCNLAHRLWSARVLTEQPALIQQVQRAFLSAGADIIATASYQATVPGLVAEGMTETEALALIRRSAAQAIEVRDAHVAATTPHRIALVAGSIGPYGAWLANGAEYRGDYGLDETALIDFHRPRVEALLDAGVDLLAFETIPSLLEARALVRLLEEYPHARAWLSFSARDGEHISEGTPMAQCAHALADTPQIIAVGVNCLPPALVSPLLSAAAGSRKPLVAYPNSGERYDAERKQWLPGDGDASVGDWTRHAVDWWRTGARLIGGCCRTGPETISALVRVRSQLQQQA
jgi:homocysteine S-methyltransferase